MEKNSHQQIDNWKSETQQYFQISDDVLICECFCVDVKDIKESFNKLNDFDINILVKKFGFSTGCTSCLKGLDKKLEHIFK